MSYREKAGDETKPAAQAEHGLEQTLSVVTMPTRGASMEDPNNPLSWPLWVKIMILTQVSILAALGGLNTATINPALAELGEEFGISTVRASYQTTVCIALNGVAPWLWIPLANKYGRRPIYLFTTFLGFASSLGCAYATSFATLVVARVFNGLFPVAFALGASTVTDLFFPHQRGRAMGFFTVTMTTGRFVQSCMSLVKSTLILNQPSGTYLWRPHWQLPRLALDLQICQHSRRCHAHHISLLPPRNPLH